MPLIKEFEHLKIQLEAIKTATNNFAADNCIGKGGFGKVYKGELVHSKGQTMVGVKRLDRSFGQGDPEFWKEIIMLSLYKHENIVSLLGFCDESGEKILVYDYVSKRSLDLYLENDELTWVRRLKICIGAARGLAYLHDPAGTQQRVLHRDIKSANILLDENWNARISDMGLSKFGPANQQYTFLVSNAVGTFGYCDPLYGETGLLTKESDVYSFGVVLFEILCGRLCMCNTNDNRRPLLGLVRECYQQNKISDIIYDNIKAEINHNSLEAFATIAYQCLKINRKERPSMEEIVRMLETALEHQIYIDDQQPSSSRIPCPLQSFEGFTFTEVNSVHASASMVFCCHFSSDGKLLASGDSDGKVVVWCTDSLKPKMTLEEHSSAIPDVRFSPSMPRLATSSYDTTVRVWDLDNPGFSLRTFMGHSISVMSLDFHPNKDDLICSCDLDGETRYWSITKGTCVRVFKGGKMQVRFQPRHGRFLAAAAENKVLILDVETHACRHTLTGHMKPIRFVCWDPNGEYLASVSEDSVRVWSLMSGNEGECVHNLSCIGNEFHSCVFHPSYASLLVIGCYQSLELWNMSENKTMTLSAHELRIYGLAVSTVTSLVASCSNDGIVKLWK